MSVFLAALCAIAVVALVPVTGQASERATPTLSQCQVMVRHQTLTTNKLTIATDNPVQPPWYEHNQPNNQLGFEGALAYKIATRLNFAAKDVRWVTEPFAQSYLPGAKAFDFDLNEIAFTTSRAKNVTFSISYYDLQQSLVALRTDKIVAHHTRSDLVKYIYGALAGSASLTYVTTHIKPTHSALSYGTLGAAETALKSHAIDALVIDTPTGNTVVNWFLNSNSSSLAIQVGQFPAVGDLYYAALMRKANPISTCLNVAITALKQTGALKTLRTTWLKTYNAVALIQP